jgi:hypothetical protein
MRFGKRLALAMIRDAGEAPYLSQKQLKHILVGLEKLAKAYTDLSASPLSESSLLSLANSYRVNCGLPEQSFPLQASEVVAHDCELLRLLDADVVQIRRYIEICESNLMVSINDWLDEAARVGLVGINATENIISNDESLTALTSRARELIQEHERIQQYISVNIAAIKKLLGRRNKNVPDLLCYAREYRNIENVCSSDSKELAEAIAFITEAILEDTQ